ncbi:MAG: hypothetical protein M0Z42_24680 [Actinomycetota bacterium]|nr:hypothetical protein [Actinomycetota bacterium]
MTKVGAVDVHYDDVGGAMAALVVYREWRRTSLAHRSSGSSRASRPCWL